MLIGVLAFVVLGAVRLGWAASFAIGALISVALLRSLEVVVKRYLIPGQHRAKRSLRLLALIKYPAVAILFYVLAKQPWLSAPALAGGLGLVYVTISVKAFWIGGMQLLQGRSG